MTDARLSQAWQEASDMETLAQRAAQTPDLSERDPAVLLARHATAARKVIENWMAIRSLRAARRSE